MANKPQGNLGKLRFGPSDCLITIFRACSRDPTKLIEDRLRCMLDTFLQHHMDSAGNKNNKLAARCCCEAGIWFYRILECHASEERRRGSDMSVIFENNLYQCCLVACCLEITISSNCLPCDFNLLLQILKLAPYDFCKVIEPVLLAEEGLPPAVVTHLTQLEEKVIKELAWTRDSPLWEKIQANEGHLPTCEKVMLPTQLEDPKITDLRPEGNLPGVSLSLGAEQSGSADRQGCSSAVNEPRKSKFLHLFSRKVYSLMGEHLRELCSSLHISAELRRKIWSCFEYSLVHCTDLMVDRHLDQLLMCAIYIMAKITNGEILFEHIMTTYESQPLASKSVCNVLISGRDGENVLTGNNMLVTDKGKHSDAILTPNTPSTHSPGPGQEQRGNLIYFYYEVYTTRMQHFANQFAPNPEGDTPPLSPYPLQWEVSPRRRRLSSSHSLYISPFNTESARPRTSGLCYHFNSSPPERLCEINNMIKKSRLPNKRCYLLSLDGENEEDGPSAKRLLLDDQSALQSRLRDVVDDRATKRDQDQSSPFQPNLP